MQFEVPQFIEVEDKIFGPLTFKQFAYIAGGAGLSFIIYTFIPFPLWILLDIPIVVFALALSFYKVNGKPFVQVVESALRFTMGGRLYIWRKGDTPLEKKVERKKEVVPETNLNVPRLSDSKLKELSWSLDVHKNVR